MMLTTLDFRDVAARHAAASGVVVQRRSFSPIPHDRCDPVTMQVMNPHEQP
jgi:hypothetical protein